ncbi:hypothetical protein CMUS01_07312 [Colletotrichum musicola]|uniref:Uncharacterized protein n=1 Tax=Colletotrichum musicola TaxID=2175873 RepID=A0A8H6NFI2_9PEZI|nr:hypothetical protein CMUS01_07312 [Colletotrichum musicola]
MVMDGMDGMGRVKETATQYDRIMEKSHAPGGTKSLRLSFLLKHPGAARCPSVILPETRDREHLCTAWSVRGGRPGHRPPGAQGGKANLSVRLGDEAAADGQAGNKLGVRLVTSGDGAAGWAQRSEWKGKKISMDTYYAGMDIRTVYC